MQYSAGGLGVWIRDNGVGMRPEVAAEGRLGHFGLRGMHERASRMGAKLRLASTPGEGTTVELLVPASVAFEQSAPSRVGAWLWARRAAQLKDSHE
jgi:nitrate/nitrite-specific signal transduction histidine kinase